MDAFSSKKEAELAKLKFAHPDVDQIKSSPEWKAWIKSQPQDIQDWVFKKIDATLAGKAIELFKKEQTINTQNQEKQTK